LAGFSLYFVVLSEDLIMTISSSLFRLIDC